MVIYIEVIVAITSIIHFITTHLTARVVALKIITKRFLISLIFINGYILLYLLNIELFDILKYGVGLLNVSITFNVKNRRQYFKCLTMYIGLNVLLGGVMGILNIYTSSLALKLFLSLIIICYTIEKYRSNIKMPFNYHDLYYDIEIFDNDQIYEFQAFLDTGNKAKESEFCLPIVFVKNRKNKIGTFKKHLQISTVNGSNMVMLYEVKEFYLKRNNEKIKKEVFIAYANIDEEMIVGIDVVS